VLLLVTTVVFLLLSVLLKSAMKFTVGILLELSVVSIESAVAGTIITVVLVLLLLLLALSVSRFLFQKC
jgi:hypothetical protein